MKSRMDVEFLKEMSKMQIVRPMNFAALGLGAAFTVVYGVADPMAALAEVREVEVEGRYLIGDGLQETFKGAEEEAFEDAKRRAAEQAGVYVKSYSEVINLELTEDRITTIAGSILEISNKEFRKVPIADGREIEVVCTIRAKVDTSRINAKDLLEKEEQLQRIEEQNRRIRELEEESRRLKEEYDKLSSQAQKEKIQQDFSENRRQSLIAIYEKNLDVYDLSNKLDVKELMETAGKLEELDPLNPIAFRAMAFVYRDQQKSGDLLQRCKSLLAKDIPVDLKIEVCAQMGDIYYHELNDTAKGRSFIDQGITLARSKYSPDEIERLVNGDSMEFSMGELQGKTNIIQQLYVLKSDIENVIPTFDSKTVVKGLKLTEHRIYNIKYRTDWENEWTAPAHSEGNAAAGGFDEGKVVREEGDGAAPLHSITNSFAKTYARQAAMLDGIDALAGAILETVEFAGYERIAYKQDEKFDGIVSENHITRDSWLYKHFYTVEETKYSYEQDGRLLCDVTMEVRLPEDLSGVF